MKEDKGLRDCCPEENKCSTMECRDALPQEILKTKARHLRDRAHAMEQLADQLEYCRFGPEAGRLLSRMLTSCGD